MSTSLTIVLECPDRFQRRVRYVLDTLLAAAGIPAHYATAAPSHGPWLLYSTGDGPSRSSSSIDGRCVRLPCDVDAWHFLEGDQDVAGSHEVDGLDVVFVGAGHGGVESWTCRFDLLANAFYFLSSWSERRGRGAVGSRHLYADSVYARYGIAQDVVDRYLQRLVEALRACAQRCGDRGWPPLRWPGGAAFGVLLSHDVDFIPAGTFDIVKQGAKTVARHVLRQRDPADGARAFAGLASALARGRDPYGCLPEMLDREASLGVKASYQVAVGHRHPNDVNYYIEDDRTRDYLRRITDAGFELALHGSYRSTENPRWYEQEAALLAERLERPVGSRQHFLSFDYDALFAAQERAGIRYDMSMGYPDACGPRAGFSHPYYPYDLARDRPVRRRPVQPVPDGRHPARLSWPAPRAGMGPYRGRACAARGASWRHFGGVASDRFWWRTRSRLRRPVLAPGRARRRPQRSRDRWPHAGQLLAPALRGLCQLRRRREGGGMNGAVFMAAYTNYRRDPRVKREAEALVDAGYRVVFMASSQPGEPDFERIAGVDVIKRRRLNTSRTSAGLYVLDYLLFFAMMMGHLLRHPRRYSLIHVNNMPDFLVFATWLPRLLGRPVIHDVHDLMPELFVEKFSSGERHPLVRMLRMQERWAGRFASAVLTVEDRLLDILSERGISRQKIRVLMNLPDDRIFAPRGPQPAKPDGAPFIMVYHGTLARRLGLDIALEALALARSRIPDARIRIIGAGEERETLLALRDSLGLREQVSFSDGYVPVETIPSLISDADVGLVPLRISGGTDIMLPTKLLEYVNLGIPCIVPKTGTISRYFDDEMVHFFDAEDAASLADAMVALSGSPDRRRAIANAATERFGRTYSWSKHRDAYVELVRQLIASGRPLNEVKH